MSQKSWFWNWIDQKVKVDLKDNRSIIGVLIGFDKHLNFVVADADELRVFHKKQEQIREIYRPLGLTIIRGENVMGIQMYQSPQQFKEQIESTQNVLAQNIQEPKEFQQEKQMEQIGQEIPQEITGL